MTKRTSPPLDLMFFLTESPQSPKHVGAVQVFELPPKAPANYLQKLVAQMRDAPVVAPFCYAPHFPRFGMPEWHDGAEWEADYHIRHSALPAPGTTAQLMEVVQRLHSGLLDRRRPCWFCQVIEGLENNRFAVYTKIHHSYIDGMSGVKRMYGSLSTSRSDRKVAPPWSFDPMEQGGEGKGGSSAGGNPVGQVLDGLRGAAEVSSYLGKLGQRALRPEHSPVQPPFAAHRTRLNRPIEWETRSTAVCTLPLDRVKAIGHARGCTVNEVVLALLGASLEEYLQARDEPVKAPLVAMCPMNIRSEGDDSATTRVTGVHVRLGEPGCSIDERLQQVIDSSHAAKEDVAGLSTGALIGYGVVIFGLWELLERSGADRYLAPSYNVLVSNVPGPGQDNLYLCGSRLLASYPISTLLPGVNLNATLLSHGNSIDFGLLGDRHALPELDSVVQRLQYHFKQLDKAHAASSKRKPRRRARPKTRTRSRRTAASK